MFPKYLSVLRWVKVSWPYLAGAVLLVGLSAFCFDILSSARAYVEGESLWSKAQKEAVYRLNLYAYSHDEADFQAYRQAIAIPLGDHRARVELQKQRPDLDVARAGLLQGKNHPDDIDGMIRLFRNFQHHSIMRAPIADWTEGDRYIAALIVEAERLRAEVQYGARDAATLQTILDRIKLINERLTPLEVSFSNNLGAASRRIEHLLLLAMGGIALLLIGAGSTISLRIVARKEAAEAQLRELAATTAAERERREADGRIRDQAALLDKARDAIIVRDIDNRVVYWNKSAERLYGWTAQQAHGMPVEGLAYDDAAAFRNATAQLLACGTWNGEFTRRRDDGSVLTVESRWTLATSDNGAVQSILAIDTDISDRKAAEDDIRRLAFYDPLTHLPNRVLLQDRLHQALALSSHSHHAGALLFIDLDNFKALNDTLGHDKGDELLQQVAARLANCVRESDTVARLGGDEFVIILSDQHDQRKDVAVRARAVAEKILDQLGEPYAIAGTEQHSAASIGIALFQGQHDTVSELLKRADLAMYQAKGAGRNTVRFFNQDMEAAVSARAALEADLRQGLRERQFQLHYQPQVDEHGRIVGTEALLRWRHPRRGMVPPSSFIPLSEETGLILPLGQWVLEAACAQLALWGKNPATADWMVGVNVSAPQFRHEGFVDQILAVLARSGANPARLKLEITESLLLDDVPATIRKMQTLKMRGVCFSLDDFGTGYSSLSYLKRLPLDQLKIDQSFVRDVLTDANDAAIARTIVALGQSLGLAVIAEGVETEGQRRFLSNNACHLFQGYLFSAPVPAEMLGTELGRASRIAVS